MSESSTSTIRSSPRAKQSLPDVLTEFAFELFIDLPSDAAEDAARLLFEGARRRFAEQNPLLAEIYELDFEETSIQYGSRNSRVRAKLRKKERRQQRKEQAAGPKLWKKAKALLAASITAVGLLSTDPDQVRENVQSAIEWTVEVLQENGVPIAITYDDDHEVPP